MTNYRQWAIFIAIIFLCLSTILVYTALLSGPRTPEPSIDLIQELWGATIPGNASNAQFGSDGSNMRLSFQASPDTIGTFTNSICGGVLHHGYDPFNANDSASPQPHSVLIKMPGLTYYSSTLSAPANIWGNRCSPTPGSDVQVHQIAVDKSDPDRYTVTFENTGGDCTSRSIPACGSMGRNYINPIADNPLLIVGLTGSASPYQLAHSEVCLDMSYRYVSESIWDNSWDYLIGAEVEIRVDEVALEPGIITNQRRLIPRTVEPGSQNSNNAFWSYCVEQDWASGLHTIRVILTPTSQPREEYNVTFFVDN